MKKILLLIAIVAFASYGSKLKAQCTLEFNNLVIGLVGAPTPYPDPEDGPNCKVTFNASFDITTNSGFKYLFFHSWLTTDYPDPAIFDCTGGTPAVDPGTRLELGQAVDEAGKSFLDIGFIGLREFLANVPIGSPQNVTHLIAASYPHDNGVVLINPTTSPGMTAEVTKVSATELHFDVENITVIINQPCGDAVNVRTDIWGSNSNANDPKAQCYICGIGQLFNDPQITGLKNCEIPRKYQLSVTTTLAGSYPITLKLFADVNENGVIDDDGDAIFNEPGEDKMVLPSPINHNLSIATPLEIGNPDPVAYEPYSSQDNVADRDLIALVTGPGLLNGISKVIPELPGCIPLPAEFKSFTANRKDKSNVSLKWETVQELNVSGFALERKITGNWEEFAFVPSQAQGGNSQTLLTYVFNDINNNKGMTQYRIKQVDQDARFKYSLIRAVRGDGQAGKTVVYPNPTADGRVTVVFEDASVTRDVSLFDMTGRALKQWKGINNNNIQIENLNPGVYSLRIVVPETGALSVEKIVVNKR